MGKAAAAAVVAAAPRTPKTAGERNKITPHTTHSTSADAHDALSPAPAQEETTTSLLSAKQLSAFQDTKSSAERLAILSAALRVVHYEANPRSLVWVDWCFSVLTFALEEAQLSPQKTLVLLRVANDVFDFATTATPPVLSDTTRNSDTITAPTSELPSVEAVYEVFRNHVRANSVAATATATATITSEQPPTDNSDPLALCVWTPADVARIVTFMSSTFFRHFAAYQHVFAFPRASLEREIALVVESPLVPTPLALALLAATPDE